MCLFVFYYVNNETKTCHERVHRTVIGFLIFLFCLIPLAFLLVNRSINLVIYIYYMIVILYL